MRQTRRYILLAQSSKKKYNALSKNNSARATAMLLVSNPEYEYQHQTLHSDVMS
jgi:hypothetical protein